MKKPTLFVGIDVGSKAFHVAVNGQDDVHEFENSAVGRGKVVAYLKKRSGNVVISMESTGVYGLDLALALHAQKRFVVRYLNPMRAKAFMKARSGRGKTDKVDAKLLAELSATLDLPAWIPPSKQALELRSITRRIRSLVNDRTREKNRLAAVTATDALADILRRDIEDSITQLDARIARLQVAALAYARQFDEFTKTIDLLVSYPGIGENTAVEILGELVCLPSDLTPRQLVAQAGLDPRPDQSGKREGKQNISKMGSSYLRAILYIAAINTVRWCPEIARFHGVLVNDRKKKPVVAYVAVARKLLQSIQGVLASQKPFDAKRFYNAPGEARSAA